VGAVPCVADSHVAWDAGYFQSADALAASTEMHRVPKNKTCALCIKVMTNTGK